MNKIERAEAVELMQRFMEDNLREELSLKTISQAVGYSPWHSGKIFKEFMGKTIFEYLRALRLSKAALKLRDEEIKVIDAAFDFHFNSHEGFTRAFSKEFGITPKKYSKKTPAIKLFMPNPVGGYYTKNEGVENMKKDVARTVFVQVVEKEARKFILRRGIKAREYFEYCDEVPCDTWGILSSIKEALGEPHGVWLPKEMIKPGTSEYAQGIEVPEDFNGEVPEDFEVIDLPKCKMMIFQGQPYEECNIGEAIDEVWEAIDRYDPKLYGFQWAEDDAPRFQLAPQGDRGYIEGRPVERI